MGIAITEEHRALTDSVAGALARHADAAVVRAVAEGQADAGVGEVRSALAAQGVLGLHVPEEHGGAGYGLVELAVVAEAFGTACAPGVLVPGLAVSAILAAAGGRVAKEHLPGLVDGSRTAGIVLGAPTIEVVDHGDRSRVSGSLGPVLGGADVDLVLAPAAAGDGVQWVVLDGAAIALEPVTAVDLTRPLARAEVDTAAVAVVELPADDVQQLLTVVVTAEAAGIAGWCLDAAVEHARVREQFGRPIGQFQGVKHTCAHMLVRVEEARAAAWDAARAVAEDDEAALATSVAAAVAIDAAHENALEAIQVLGGIGFTWEHDAHWYLRRAATLRTLLGGGDRHRGRVAELALDGHRRHLHVELDGEAADRTRVAVREFAASVGGMDEDARRSALADSGFQVPHWPAPWGRDASPVEQLVIDEELAAAGIDRPNLFIGGWILPTIIGFGTEAQQEQFIRPTLRGELTWCQLFSEPGAGSDLAAISTRATKVDGGWSITGQKVWTSLAHRSDWGLLIARTDPGAPKHDGITAFLLDMQHSDGIDIRPLREITGNEMFNEVFLDDVFVPDAMVVGPVDGGWKAARNTLANERVAMSSGSAMGSGVEQVLAFVPHSPRADDPVVRDRLGGLVAEGQVLGLLGHRTTLAQLSGVEPGASSSVRKLVGGHHARACADLALELLGPAGVVADGPGERASFMFLQAQCLTIAGGTTNVQLNVIAERLLGLPRDP